MATDTFVRTPERKSLGPFLDDGRMLMASEIRLVRGTEPAAHCRANVALRPVDLLIVWRQGLRLHEVATLCSAAALFEA